jgi:hypothetical protein
LIFLIKKTGIQELKSSVENCASSFLKKKLCIFILEKKCACWPKRKCDKKATSTTPFARHSLSLSELATLGLISHLFLHTCTLFQRAKASGRERERERELSSLVAGQAIARMMPL